MVNQEKSVEDMLVDENQENRPNPDDMPQSNENFADAIDGEPIQTAEAPTWAEADIEVEEDESPVRRAHIKESVVQASGIPVLSDQKFYPLVVQWALLH